jgi:replicative DNA helicase
MNYKGYAGNIFINEGIGDIGIEQIRQKIADHKKIRGKTPVIIIDYLQILASYNDRASDKQNTDKAVLELKRIARDEKTPVLAISSFNRGNYSAGANMAAFKESGAIEYSSDVLIALQPYGMKGGEKDSDKAANAETMNKCKASTERNIEAVILKNRNGQTGTTATFKYYAKFNCFVESIEINMKTDKKNDIFHEVENWDDIQTG